MVGIKRGYGIVEGADYVLDMEELSSRKRISWDAKYHLGMELVNLRNKRTRGVTRGRSFMFGERHVDFDENYLSFLVDLQKITKRKFQDEDDGDPAYVMFLENMKEYGEAYMLGACAEQGVCSPIVYELEDVQPGSHRTKRSSPRFCKGNAVREERASGEMMKRRTRSRKSQYIQEEQTPGELLKRKSPRSRWGNNTQEQSLNVSADFESFPEHSKNSTEEVDMTSPEMIKRTTRRSCRNYIREVRTPGKVMKRKISPGRINSHEKRSLNVNGDSDLSPKDVTNYMQEERTLPETMKKKTQRSCSNGYIQKEKTPGEMIKWTTLECQRGLNIQEEQSSDFNGDSKLSPENSDLQIITAKPVNEVYSMFLNSLQAVGESLFYEHGDQERVYYESPDLLSHQPIVMSTKSDQQITNFVMALPSKEPVSAPTRPYDISKLSRKFSKLRITIPATPTPEQSEKDMSLLPLQLIQPVSPQRTLPQPSTKSTASRKLPSSPSKTLILSDTSDKPLNDNLKDHCEGPSKLCRKLLEILSKPYNEKEHEALWREVIKQSPVVNHRESRSGGSNRTGRMGRSLLDWHPEFKREIEEVQNDPHKVLNLLRFLSLYVQKLECKGISERWMVKFCKTVMPEDG